MVKVLMVGMQAEESLISINDTEFELSCTNMAAEILAYIKNTPPHAIVLHMDRLKQQALKILRQIKRNPSSRHTPIIFLVNDENEGMIEQFYEDVNTVGLLDTASLDSILFHVKQLVVKKLKARKKIMVVDDDELTRSITNRFLHPEYQIINAASAKEALQYLEQGTVDLFILDIMMPEVDGIELFKRLQQMETVKDIPKLFQTSVADIKTVKTCIQLGPVGYIVKPIDKEALLNRVDYIFTYGVERPYGPDKREKILYIDKNESNIRQVSCMLQDKYEIISESGGIHTVTTVEDIDFKYLMINMENSRFCLRKLQKKMEELKKFVRIILIATDQNMEYGMSTNAYFNVTVLKYPINKEVLVETLEADG